MQVAFYSHLHVLLVFLVLRFPLTILLKSNGDCKFPTGVNRHLMHAGMSFLKSNPCLLVLRGVKHKKISEVLFI